MNRFSQMLAVVSLLVCAVVQLNSVVAFGIGVSVTGLSYWICRRWPDPKPSFLSVVSRPEAKTLREEKRSIALVAGTMIFGGLICLFFLPQIEPANIFTHFWPPMGAHIVGQGIGTAIFGWIAASKDVAAHNEWVAKMGGNPSRN